MKAISLAIAFIAVLTVAIGSTPISASVASSSSVVDEATPANSLNRRDNKIEDRQGPAEIVVASVFEEEIVFAKTDNDAETETGTAAA